MPGALTLSARGNAAELVFVTLICVGAAPAVGSWPKLTNGESRNATVWLPVDDGAFTPSTSLALGWCHGIDFTMPLKTLPGREVGMGSEPPAVSEITARLAYVAMTATTSKLAANMPRLRVNGGAFFASPHRISSA